MTHTAEHRYTETMEDILQKLTTRKEKLDRYQPLPPALVRNLYDWYKVELTYTSNAIEGNTLSRVETAQIVEKGITVEGKTIVEHLEAVNHAEALDFLQSRLSQHRQKMSEEDILSLHRIILHRIDDANAGRYRDVPVRIAGFHVVMPNHVKVPSLMQDLISWFHQDTADHPAKRAADAHIKFVSIHPFVDGNGRVGRLLLNLLLLQEGYPPAIIRKEDRRAYIESIAKVQMGDDISDYYNVIYQAIDRSLDIYLEMLEPEEDEGEIKKR